MEIGRLRERSEQLLERLRLVGVVRSQPSLRSRPPRGRGGARPATSYRPTPFPDPALVLRWSPSRRGHALPPSASAPVGRPFLSAVPAVTASELKLPPSSSQRSASSRATSSGRPRAMKAAKRSTIRSWSADAALRIRAGRRARVAADRKWSADAPQDGQRGSITSARSDAL